MSWSELREAITEAVSRFDPARTSVAGTADALREITVMRNVLGAAAAIAAARVAESDRWRLAGARTPAEHLARACGIGIGEARRTLSIGQAVGGQPTVLAAARSGALSPAQTALVSEAVEAAPDDAERLLHLAASTSLAELRTECARVRANSDPDPTATHARIHDGRRLWQHDEPDGSMTTTIRGTRLDGAWLASVLAPVREEMVERARRDGRRIAADAADYDALYALLGRSTEAGTTGAAATEARTTEGRGQASRRDRRRWSRAVVIVRVDATAAERGEARGRELCEIAGAGPVSVTQVQDMLGGGAALAVLSTRDERVETVAHVATGRSARVDIGDPSALRSELARTGRAVAGTVHRGRRPTAHQCTALRWISPVCSVEGCSNPRCDIDHRTGWAITRTTRLDDLDPLCRFHHNLKTRDGWTLVDGHGVRAFVPATDVRHPRHTRAG